MSVQALIAGASRKKRSSCPKRRAAPRRRRRGGADDLPMPQDYEMAYGGNGEYFQDYAHLGGADVRYGGMAPQPLVMYQPQVDAYGRYGGGGAGAAELYVDGPEWATPARYAGVDPYAMQMHQQQYQMQQEQFQPMEAHAPAAVGGARRTHRVRAHMMSTPSGMTRVRSHMAKNPAKKRRAAPKRSTKKTHIVKAHTMRTSRGLTRVRTHRAHNPTRRGGDMGEEALLGGGAYGGDDLSTALVGGYDPYYAPLVGGAAEVGGYFDEAAYGPNPYGNPMEEALVGGRRKKRTYRKRRTTAARSRRSYM